MSDFTERPTTPTRTPTSAPARPIKTPKSGDMVGSNDDTDLDTSIVSYIF